MPTGGAPARPRAVGVISLGCPKNLIDTEVMLGLLQEAGFRIVSDVNEADVLLVNTCCFIQPARDEAAEALDEGTAWHQAGEGRILICAGCWPEMQAEELRVRFPEIDAFMGPGDVPHIADIVEQALAGAGPTMPTERPPYLYSHTTARICVTPPWMSYVKIADGCDHRCRFCLIPRLRGPFRSRSLASIVQEAQTLAKRGVRETNLVAQDTTAYGSDTGEADVADLLAALSSVEELHWIRLLYAFPTYVDDRLIEVMAREKRICQYIDIPFQHADREVLRRMGRPGDGKGYLSLIERLRTAMPDIAIRSTFLVGFPGEGEEEFRRLLEFLERAQLDRAGAFPFSSERGTPAAQMGDQIPVEETQQRFHELMMLQQRISLERNQRWIGRELDVLIETRGEQAGDWIGRSFRDAPEIDGAVIINSLGRPLQPGQYVQTTIRAAEPYDLIADVNDTPKKRRPARALSRRSSGRGKRR